MNLPFTQQQFFEVFSRYNEAVMPLQIGMATVSVGASGYPRDAREEQVLRKQADGAMYAAKGAGGNRYVFYRW